MGLRKDVPAPEVYTNLRIVAELAQARQINDRVAAYLVAVERVAQAVRVRGWV